MSVGTAIAENTVTLGLGQLKAAKGDDIVLACLGLGSCVAICAWDPGSKVGGMAHMVLPNSGDARNPSAGNKFVDKAIPALLDDMIKLGAQRSRLVVKLVGGAQVVAASASTDLFNIGQRNADASKKLLQSLGINVRASDVGGNRGRTARLYLDSGKLLVSKVGERPVEL